jgi:hypothetical protein
MQENTQQRTRKRSLRDSSLRICAVSRSRRNSSRCDIVCAILLGPTFASVNTHRELPVTSAPETLAGTQSLNVRSLREHTASSFLAIALSLSLSLSRARLAKFVARRIAPRSRLKNHSCVRRTPPLLCLPRDFAAVLPRHPRSHPSFARPRFDSADAVSAALTPSLFLSLPRRHFYSPQPDTWI